MRTPQVRLLQCLVGYQGSQLFDVEEKFRKQSILQIRFGPLVLERGQTVLMSHEPMNFVAGESHAHEHVQTLRA